MVNRKMKCFRGLMFLLVGYFSISAIAGVTGKITGLVSDKNSGEALVGANVLVESQMFGAASDTAA